MTLSVTGYIPVNGWMIINESWIERDVNRSYAAYFKAIVQHSPIEAEENQEIFLRIVGVPVEIRTGHLLDTSQKLFSLSLLFLLLVLHSTFTTHKNRI
jgi:hypothetical protein